MYSYLGKKTYENSASSYEHNIMVISLMRMFFLWDEKINKYWMSVSGQNH